MLTGPRVGAPATAEGCVIWRMLDGKPGHENQSLGLCQSLERLLPVERVDIVVSSRWRHLFQWLFGRFPPGVGLPAPDLILGAGHSTHLALLAAKRCYRGRSLVLMKPSLPARLFDLCIVPEHDNATGSNLFPTQGVLNTIQASPVDPEGQTLILVGGLSEHFGWSDSELLEQILFLVEKSPGQSFILTTSRRTPASFIDALKGIECANLRQVPWQETPQGWVSQQLALSRDVWVTEDSVSMVYEALTSGGGVGVLQLPEGRPSRVAAGITRLLSERRLTSFDQWRQCGSLEPQKTPFNEAQRCAAWIYEQWLKKN